MVVEALRVALVQVDARLAVDHEVGERLARAATVRHPDRLAQPQPARRAELADERHAVGGEGHEPVEGARQRDVAQRRQQAAGLLARGREVLGGEGALRRMRARAGRCDVLGGAQERRVQVGADAVGLADLPQVHRAVLVAQDRIADLALRAAQLGQRLGQGVDVLDRMQREAPAGQAHDARPPDAGGEDDVVGADRAPAGVDGADPAAAGVQPGDLAVAERLQCAGGDRAASQRLGRLQGLADPVVGDEQAAEDALRIDERQLLGDLGRRQETGLQAEGQSPPVAPVELLPALGRRRDLDAADGVEAADAGVERDRSPGEPGHRVGRVDLEHETRGVRRRAARLPQRPLVDEDDVGPTQTREVVCQTGARDAAPHDHHACRARQRRCVVALPTHGA